MEPAPADPSAASVTAPATDVLHPDLAAAAVQPQWQFEGGGSAPPSGAYDDTEDKKIRRAAVGTIVGGSIGIVGLATMAGSGVAYGVGSRKTLDDIEDDTGNLPPANRERQRVINTA